MKNDLITIFTLSIFSIGCSSMYHANNPEEHRKAANKYPSPFEFSMVDSVKGTKGQLYVKANEWMAKTFGSSKQVIQMQDKEEGKLIGKALFVYSISDGLASHPMTVNYTLSIDTKDGRYRCRLSDFTSEDYGVNLSDDKLTVIGINTTGYFNKIKSNTMTSSENLMNDLKRYMHSKSDDF